MAELADAPDLGSGDFGRKGSTPFVRTINPIGVKVMLKKLGISAVAALIALGTLSVTEAATADNGQNELCRRGGYCYDQNYSNGDNNGNCYDNGYCGRGRGCW